MVEQYVERVHTEHAVLDIGEDIGALVIYTREEFRGKEIQAMGFRWTDDPSAPAVALREEDVLKTYPWTYRVLTDNLRKRYSDFIENNSYHAIRRPLEGNKKLVLTRSLNPDNPTTSRQRFYSPNIVNEFDKHYHRRTKA